MGETLCQIVIVENTTGAGGTFLDALVRDRPSETRRRNSSRHLCGDQGPIRVLCHECRRSTRRRATVLEMKEGPPGSAIRSPIPSHRERLWSKAMVVSVAETSGP